MLLREITFIKGVRRKELGRGNMAARCFLYLKVYIFFLCSMHYFPLDGVLAERLFTAFDKDRNGHIDCDEFLGLYIYRDYGKSRFSIRIVT